MLSIILLAVIFLMVIAIGAIVGGLTGGLIFILFGDLIACIGIIAWLNRRKKNKRK